jgi:hypothetical protein
METFDRIRAKPTVIQILSDLITVGFIVTGYFIPE